MTRKAAQAEITERPRLNPHELGISSFGRIVLNKEGKMNYPRALGDGYQRQRETLQNRAQQVLTSVDNRHKPTNDASPEVQQAYELGRAALQTFLADFSVPRPTNGESPMQLSMFEWAQRNEFHAEVDTVGNVAAVIPGLKNGKKIDLSDPSQIGDVVVLHHHLDKVAIAKEGSGKHPNTEPVEVEVDQNGDWIRAQGGLTTLGADNGAGGAIAWKMAEHYSQSTDNHPTIVVLATVGEEGETDGAQHISFTEGGIVKTALNKTKYIINNDYESPKPDPEIIVGSYGLELFETKYAPTLEAVDTDLYDILEIDVDGLAGGHSGLYPDRASAGTIIINHLKNTLHNPSEHGWRLCSFMGGEKHNQISQHARAVIAIPKGTPEETIAQLKIPPQPDNLTPEDNFTFNTGGPKIFPTQMLDENSTEDVFGLLSDYATLQGAKNSVDYHPTPTSTQRVFTRSFNIGEIVVEPNDVHFTSSSRIGLPLLPGQSSEFGEYQKELDKSIGKHGRNRTTLTLGETLPTWKLDNSSTLPSLAREAYEGMPGKPVEFPNLQVRIVTAGLEVAFFQETFPNAEQLVFSMNITDIHNPGEALNVSSFLANAALMREFLDKLFAKLAEESSILARRG